MLIADDETAVRLAVRLILEERGHRVFEASDTEAAYAELTASDFDVVLLDVRMPGNGLTLLARLRAEADAEDASPSGGSAVADRTILLTADLTRADTAAVIASGQRHLRKPFRFEALVALVEEVGRDRSDPA